MNLSVLHLPLETGNQVRAICRSLRQHNVWAVGLNWRYIDYVGEASPQLIRSDGFEMAGALDDMIQDFDILHYHTGYTIFRDKSDLLFALNSGKKAVMHHRGNDVRLPSAARRYNPYVYTGQSMPEQEMINNLTFFSKHLSVAIVQDFELYDYVKDYYEHVYIVPRIIDTKQLIPNPNRANPVPLVVHSPTNREFKGTADIMKVVQVLQKRIDFEFVLLEKASYPDVLSTMSQADIVIDQVLCGSYGNVSVEAMALGRPVVCYIRDDIRDRMDPKPPIVSAHPDSLYDTLQWLLSDPSSRERIGKEGRKYVKQVHDASNIAQKLIEIYRSL